MRKRYAVIYMLIALCFAVFIAGCGKVEEFGSSGFNAQVTSVKDILQAPETFSGKNVKVEGEILNECPTGCWIDLKDDTAVVYVDMNPSGFAIPQRVGKKAEVQGKVVIKDGKIRIIGEGVRIK